MIWILYIKYVLENVAQHEIQNIKMVTNRQEPTRTLQEPEIKNIVLREMASQQYRYIRANNR